MSNYDIKQYAKTKNVWLWEVADELGIMDCNFSRDLRHEFTEKKKAHIRNIIDEISIRKQNSELKGTEKNR